MRRASATTAAPPRRSRGRRPRRWRERCHFRWPRTPRSGRDECAGARVSSCGGCRVSGSRYRKWPKRKSRRWPTASRTPRRWIHCWIRCGRRSRPCRLIQRGRIPERLEDFAPLAAELLDGAHVPVTVGGAVAGLGRGAAAGPVLLPAGRRVVLHLLELAAQALARLGAAVGREEDRDRGAGERAE